MPTLGLPRYTNEYLSRAPKFILKDSCHAAEEPSLYPRTHTPAACRAECNGGVYSPSPNRRFQSVVHARVSRHEGLRSEEHTSELQSRFDLVCRLLLEKKKEST